MGPGFGLLRLETRSKDFSVPGHSFGVAWEATFISRTF